MGATSSRQVLEDDDGGPAPIAWYQGNDFTERLALTDVLQNTWQLDQHEAEAWGPKELAAVRSRARSGEPLPEAAVTWLWRGVPDSCKEVVWSAASGDQTMARGEAKEHYDRRLMTAFGEHVPESFERCPTFGHRSSQHSAVHDLEQCVPFFHLLSHRGTVAAERLLWCCCQVWHSQIELCPVLPVLVCLLLVFFHTEEAVHAVVSAVLDRAEEDQRKRDAAPAWAAPPPFPYLPLTEMHWGGVVKRTVALATELMPEAVEHLQQLGVDLERVAAQSLQDGLARRLPFRALCRLYGAFLAKGSEVFARSLVALWSHHRKEMLRCPSREVAEVLLLCSPRDSGVIEEPRRPRAQEKEDGQEALVDESGGIVLGVDDLVRLALHIRLPRSLVTIPSEAVLLPKPSDDEEIDDVPFCRPRLQSELSFIVWDELWPYIWQWLPPLYRIRDPVRRFARHRDGYSLTSLMVASERIESNTPALLVAKVRVASGSSGETGVIGAFLPIPLKPTGGMYLDLGDVVPLGVSASDAFVFRATGGPESHGSPQAWNWTGRNQALFNMSLDSEFLCIGYDSPAIWINGDLRSGSTRSCASFGSPPLLSVADEEENGNELAARPDGMGPDSMDFDLLDIELYELD